MVDIPGDASTSSSIAIGATLSDQLEIVGDHDWFRINLAAGQAITVTLNGVTLDDSYLRIRNSSGTVLFENDDVILGSDLNSRVSFAATFGGVYYIDVGAFDDASAGSYQLSVASYQAPPVGTIDQFATQLISGYYGGDSQRFNVSSGGNITVNITALTGAGQNVARDALALWSDVTGIGFVEVSTGGQIVFDDAEAGASTQQDVTGNFTTRADVNVSTQWLADYGTAVNSYGFQTYVHEIGHALGLGHAGNYNEEARYPYDALYANDSWPISVMSYFDQRENDYFANQGFSRAYAVTPMLADIVAMSRTYGLSTTTRTSDTTYGFNSNAGRAVFDASANPAVAYTIFDSGGNDTLDYSGFSNSQRIDLNPETFSDVGGRVGTVTIARGVIIENAIGGSGADTIIGNAANNLIVGGAGTDTLTGGAGADTFKGTISTLNSDRITDLTSGDRILFTDASIGSFSFSLSGTTLSYSGGSMTLNGVVGGSLSASAASGGGVVLAFAGAVGGSSEARSDFNGDGRSDILWRNDAGTLSDWLGQVDGRLVANDGSALRQTPTDWFVAGVGDFNGDGRADILWRGNAGGLSDWLGQANGGFANNDANALRSVGTDWKVVGTGDFNGDGRDDILWRNASGVLSDWLGSAVGGFIPNDGNALRQTPGNWTVVGTGDFNGDGRDDILWRSSAGALSDWLGQAGGGFAPNDGNALTQVGLDWRVVGTGDFNGDGRDDILWRNANGALSDWLGTTAGGFVPNDANAFRTAPVDWQVAAVGDYNGDGRDDIAWRSNGGGFSDWLGTVGGGFANNDGNAFSTVTTNWHLQPDYLI